MSYLDTAREELAEILEVYELPINNPKLSKSLQEDLIVFLERKLRESFQNGIQAARVSKVTRRVRENKQAHTTSTAKT